jgi:hypothetical protein
VAPVNENRPRTCFLYGAVEVSALCRPRSCSFWEDEASSCVLERIGLRATLDERPELARWLLAVRRELSSSKLELPQEPLPPYNLLPLPGFRR